MMLARCLVNVLDRLLLYLVWSVCVAPLLRFEHALYETCRGIVTADVLELGLSRGAIAARKLEGVKRDKEHEGLYWFGPLR